MLDTSPAGDRSSTDSSVCWLSLKIRGDYFSARDAFGFFLDCSTWNLISCLMRRRSAFVNLFSLKPDISRSYLSYAILGPRSVSLGFGWLSETFVANASGCSFTNCYLTLMLLAA